MVLSESEKDDGDDDEGNIYNYDSVFVSSCSRAARCSFNLLREAEVFDWRWRAAAGKIFLRRPLI